MKKRICFLLLICLSLCPPAHALTQSPAAPDPVSLKRLSGYVENNGSWSAHSDLADATLDYMIDSAASFAYNGCCFFYLEMTGDRQLGLLTPTLVCYSLGNTALNARALCLAFDGMRYDLPVVREAVSFPGCKGEKLTAFLDAEGLSMLRALSQAEKVDVRIVGDRVYTTSLEAKSQTAQKKIVECASLSASAALPDLTEGYQLWDLSRAAFEQKYGMDDCAMTSISLEPIENDPYHLDKTFQQLTRGDSNQGVLALQKLLVAQGFLQGTPDNSYGERTAIAVRRAQRSFGLMETGCCDRALLACLTEGPQPEAADTPAAPSEVTTREDRFSLALDRFWFAQAFALSAQSGTPAYCVANTDHVLLIAEGSLQNLSPEELNLYWQFGGELSCGKYRYTASAACESDQGTRMGSSLLPMDEARLIVYAEVPAALAAQPQDWTLTLHIGDETVETTLNAR